MLIEEDVRHFLEDAMFDNYNRSAPFLSYQRKFEFIIENAGFIIENTEFISENIGFIIENQIISASSRK